MSKSLRRVEADLAAASIETEVIRMPQSTRTAAEAAAAIGCALDQIGKSIIFRGLQSDAAILFVTAGGNRVDGAAAERLAGEPLGRADAAFIRDRTGFAIGGVAPVGHLHPVRTYMDRRLLDFPVIWCAAGTPRDNFAIAPDTLRRITGAEIGDFGNVAEPM